MRADGHRSVAVRLVGSGRRNVAGRTRPGLHRGARAAPGAQSRSAAGPAGHRIRPGRQPVGPGATQSEPHGEHGRDQSARSHQFRSAISQDRHDRPAVPTDRTRRQARVAQRSDPPSDRCFTRRLRRCIAPAHDRARGVLLRPAAHAGPGSHRRRNQCVVRTHRCRGRIAAQGGGYRALRSLAHQGRPAARRQRSSPDDGRSRAGARGSSLPGGPRCRGRGAERDRSLAGGGGARSGRGCRRDRSASRRARRGAARSGRCKGARSRPRTALARRDTLGAIRALSLAGAEHHRRYRRQCAAVSQLQLRGRDPARRGRIAGCDRSAGAHASAGAGRNQPCLE